MKKLKYMLFIFINCFLFLSSTKAITCVYEGSYPTPGNTTNTKVTCNVTNSGVSCTSNNLSVTSSGVTLKPENFKTGNNLSCKLDKIYVHIEASENQITSISTTSVAGAVYNGLNLNKNESTTTSTPVEEPTPTNDYENDTRYQQAKADADKYCDEMNFAFQDDAKCAESKEKMQAIKDEYASKNGGSQDVGEYSPTAFCQRKEVKGTFRAIGWIIFITKILVPILLIVFGTIDVAKAIIASKDDEIKKSFKTIAIRAFAGVIIFFIPTLIDFIVTIFGGNNIYNEENGSFGYCTHCLLKPTDEACGNLMGGN